MKLKPFREAPDKKLGVENDRLLRDFCLRGHKNENDF